MAKMKIEGLEDFGLMLRSLGDKTPAVMAAAVYAGAGVLAEAVKSEIQALPTQEGFLRAGDKRAYLTRDEKADLLQAVGIARFDHTGGKVTTAVGVEGYSSHPTRKYPGGVPLPIIARSIESGSSVREKNPFMRRAGQNAKGRAQQAMTDAAVAELDKITGGR